MISTLFLLIVITAVCFKVYIKVTTGIYKGNERLDGKTVIITGASSGLGEETAKDFAKRGARVVMLCRDTAKGAAVRSSIVALTGNENIIVKHVDFESLTSVRKCANELLNEEPKIDILVNNIGDSYKETDDVSEDGLNLLMQINHFGGFLLTNILLDRIKQSAPSRIVNVASYMHQFATLDLNDLQQRNVTSKNNHYCNTKLANIYMTIALAEKLKGTGVTVNSLHPGVVASGIIRRYNPLVREVSLFLEKIFYKSVWEGVQTTIYVSVSPSLENVTGKYFSDCHETPTSKEANDLAKAKKLWELSEVAVKLKENERHY